MFARPKIESMVAPTWVSLGSLHLRCHSTNGMEIMSIVDSFVILSTFVMCYSVWRAICTRDLRLSHGGKDWWMLSMTVKDTLWHPFNSILILSTAPLVNRCDRCYASQRPSMSCLHVCNFHTCAKKADRQRRVTIRMERPGWRCEDT